MVRPETVTILAAAGAPLLAAGILSNNTTGWAGIAAGGSFWLGVVGLVVAAAMLLRQGLPPGVWRRVGFALVAAGLVTVAGGLIWVWSADDVPCDDTGLCIHPAAERFTLLGNLAAGLLLLGTATLLVDVLVGARARGQPAV